MDRNIEEYVLLIKNKKKDSTTNVVRFKIYYRKSGYNYGTGESYPSGFAVVSTPAEKTNTCTSFGAFSGFIDRLGEPVERFSKKRGEEAVKLFEANFAKYQKWYKEKYGYDIELGVYYQYN